MVAANGISSSPLPSRTKWIGPSMWVPVWAPIEISETLATSPFSMLSARSIRTGGLSGQWTMPLCSETETSIQPFSMLLPPLSERPVEVEGGADKGQVREGLREVAQRLPAGPDLLRIEPQVVRVA